jgi:hypothetical protein
VSHRKVAAASVPPEGAVADPCEEVGDPVVADRCRGRAGALADVVVDDQLARGPTVARSTRSLDSCVDGTNRRSIDLVAPELEPDRAALVGGEDVDHAAADGELAAPLDHVGPVVPERDQAVRQDVGRGLVARGELERRGRPRGRGDPLDGRDRRRDHHERTSSAQPPDRRRPPRRDLRLGDRARTGTPPTPAAARPGPG